MKRITRPHNLWLLFILGMFIILMWSHPVDTSLNTHYKLKYEKSLKEYDELKNKTKTEIDNLNITIDSLYIEINKKDQKQIDLIDNNNTRKDETIKTIKGINDWSDIQRDSFWYTESSRYDPIYRFDTLQNISQ